jgi:hypothetical protein
LDRPSDALIIGHYFKKAEITELFYNGKKTECPELGARAGATRTGDLKCREVKTGFGRKRPMQTGSSETLIGWKSGKTTWVPLWDRMEGVWLHLKKKVREFPVPSRDVTTKLSLGGNNDVTTELFLPRESLVSDITAGDRKLVSLFLRCMDSDIGDWV